MFSHMIEIFFFLKFFNFSETKDPVLNYTMDHIVGVWFSPLMPLRIHHV